MLNVKTANADHECNISTLPEVALEGSTSNTNACDMRETSLETELQHQHQFTRSVVSIYSCVCRICHMSNAKEPLVSPCRCKGTLAFVHLTCLERWLNQSCRSYCELCRYHFNAIKTPRYRCLESLRIWIRHPRNRRHIQSDLLILTLLTIITIGLVAICLLGMRYFIIEGKKIGISRLWTRGAISFFLTIVIVGYLTTMYLLVKDQVSPWYRWWKSTVNVRLVMDSQPTQEPSNVSLEDEELDNQTMDSVATSNVDKSRSFDETRV